MAKDDGKKRYRYQLTSDPVWRDVVPLLRKINPKLVLKWLMGQKVAVSESEFHKVEKQVESQKQALSSLSTRVKTLDDLLREGNVDLEQWEVSSYTQNFWECGSKNPSGVILPCTLYQVKAILKPLVASSTALFDGILADVKKASRPVKKINYPKMGKDLLIEICVFDLHLAKLAFDKNGKNLWTLKKAEKVYDDIINDTLSRVDISRIDRFVLPTGNDLLNYDSPTNTTTKGTPQDGPEYWENIMLFAFQMLKRNIEKLSGIAPVYVPIVPGNHSENSMFSLGAMLDAAFSANENIHIDNTPRQRKCHHYGQILLAYTHGNRLKARDLHALMSTEWPLLFGKTKYRAWRKGHLHTNRKSRILFQDYKDEFQGVEVEIVPSVTVTDSWHYLHGYMGNIRRSKSFVWCKNKGLQQELYYNL